MVKSDYCYQLQTHLITKLSDIPSNQAYRLVQKATQYDRNPH